MFINYKNYNLPIENVELIESNTILLLKTSSYTYKYEAIGDCCSTSFIKKYKEDFSSIIGKIIKSVKEIQFEDEYISDKDCDYCTSPHLYQIKFKNSNKTFEFLMINYSNGYYDGWITSYVII